MCQVIVVTVGQILKCCKVPSSIASTEMMLIFTIWPPKLNPSHSFSGATTMKGCSQWHRLARSTAISEGLWMPKWKQDFICPYLASSSGNGADFGFTFTVTVMLESRITDGRNLIGVLPDTSICQRPFCLESFSGINCTQNYASNSYCGRLWYCYCLR